MTCDDCMPRQEMDISNEHEESQYPEMLVMDANCPVCGEYKKCYRLHPRHTPDESDFMRHAFLYEVR